MNKILEYAYIGITFSLATAAAFAFIVIPGVGVLLGVISLGMVAVGYGGLNVRQYVNSIKDKIAARRRKE